MHKGMVFIFMLSFVRYVFFMCIILKLEILFTSGVNLAPSGLEMGEDLVNHIPSLNPSIPQ
jgi:hypothetical protein